MSVLEPNEFKATTKTMVVGGTYLTNENERVVYLGRYPLYANSKGLIETKEDSVMKYNSTNKGKKDWFKQLDNKKTTFFTFPRIKQCVSTTPHKDTTTWIEKLAKESRLNEIVEQERHYVRTKEELFHLLKELRDTNDATDKKSIYLLNDKGALTYHLECKTECAPMFLLNTTDRSEYKNFTKVPNENYTIGAIVCNVFISNIFVGINPQHEDDFQRNTRTVNHFDTKRYELKYIEMPSHHLLTDGNKHMEKARFALSDAELSEQVEILWSQIGNLFEDEVVYYATYGYKNIDEVRHNLINVPFISLNHD